MINSSILITPNYYGEGKLLSIIPTDGSGDMDVVRATTATRVNSAGLIEVVPRNLFTYSEQFENANWVKNRITITSNATTSPDGTTTADLLDTTANGSGSSVTQNINSVSGTRYNISLFVKRNNVDFFLFNIVNSAFTNGVRIWFNINTKTISSTSNVGSGLNISNTLVEEYADGWLRLSTSVIADDSLIRAAFFITNANGVFSSIIGDKVYLWGAQLDQGSTATEYYPTTTRLNIPRIDYTNGICPSILVEPQRTNEFFRSEEFDNAFWPKSGVTIIANDTISPDGNLTADRVTIVDVGQGTIAKSYSRTNYTLSVFAKKGNSNLISISLLGSNHRADFNLDLGTIIYSSGTGVSPKIEDYGNGWFRCILENVPSITQLRIYAGGIGTAAVNDYIYLWGAQIEAGANATSYIQTVASTVTRNSDVIFNDNFVVANNSNFAVSGEFFLLEDRNELYGRSGAIILRLFLTGRTSFSYFISFQRHSNKFNLRYKNDLGNNLQVSTDEDFNFGVWNKYAVSVEVGVGFKIAINGVLEFFPDTSIVAMTTDRISTNAYDNSNMGGKIQNIITYPTALTDEQCIALTTI